MTNLTKEERQELLQGLHERYNLECAKTYEVTNNNKTVYITILLGGLDKINPKSFMDNVVSEFVARRMYNEYVDANLDNPWLRIIIEDINDLIN